MGYRDWRAYIQEPVKIITLAKENRRSGYICSNDRETGILEIDTNLLPNQPEKILCQEETKVKQSANYAFHLSHT